MVAAHMREFPLRTAPGLAVAMPAVALGTWKLSPDDAFEVVTSALDAGYRHLDCAPVYKNQSAIGAALGWWLTTNEGKAHRKDLFITSKIMPSKDLLPGNYEGDVRKTLSELNVPYLDLCLLHWPLEFGHSTLEDMWSAMESLVREGLCRAVGVSNFSVKKLARILETAEIPVSVNQIELHAMFRQDMLVKYCQSNGVHVTSYGPLGSFDQWDEKGLGRKCPEPVRLIDHPDAKRVAEAAGCTPAQALLAWIVLRRGCSCAPKTVRKERMAENLAVGSNKFLSDHPAKRAALVQLDNVEPQVRLQHGSFHTGPVESGKAYRTLAELWDEDCVYYDGRDFETPAGFVLR